MLRAYCAPDFTSRIGWAANNPLYCPASRRGLVTSHRVALFVARCEGEAPGDVLRVARRRDGFLPSVELI